jgi:galactokinase/galacturonokinase
MASVLAERIKTTRATVRSVVSPYRICPVGAHVDHQGGAMLATAIDAATRLVFVPSDRVEVESRNFPGTVGFDPAVVIESGQMPDIPEWGRYVWAAFAALRHRLPSRPRGFTGIIEGRLPGSGLSSSASVLLAYLTAWAEVNSIELDAREQVLLSVDAENEHVGVACGVLDPAAIVGSLRGHLLAIDSTTVSWEPIPLGPAAAGARFLVLFTGTERSLLSTDFNLRVRECREAACWAADRLGVSGIERLGDLDREELRSVLDQIPGAMQRRARHFLEESERVSAAGMAWREGRLADFGAIMSDSCRSSIDNYETGSEELIALQSIWETTEGVLGARFSGAGFGGCSVALVQSDAVENVGSNVSQRFLEMFPTLGERVQLIEVESHGGLALQ